MKTGSQFAELDHELGNRLLIAVTALLCIVFALKFILFFQGERIGHDYSFFYPKLAAYKYWIARNGYLSIPHFLPYMCAGVFDFADPISFYLSFPTIALLALPFGWVWPATVIAFGAIGFGGGYALARYGMRLSRMAALICGTVILFNGFYFTRMAVGHASFHGFMLLPWIAAFCMVKDGSSWLPSRVGIGCTGLAYAYLIHSGGVYLLLPSAVSTLAIVLAASANARDLSISAARYFLGGMAGVFISAPKIIETLHLMSNFPRDFFPLPGFSGIFELLQFLISALFYWPSISFANAHFVNAKYAFELHEAVFSVSVLPLAAMVLFVATRLDILKANLSMATCARYIALILLLAVPIALNVYEPHWNQLLKKLPVIGQSTLLTRYFSAYIVPLAAFSAYVFNRLLRGHSPRLPLFAAAIAIPLCGFLTVNLDEFTRVGYDPKPIVRVFEPGKSVRRNPIIGVTAFGKDERIFRRMGADDLMVHGLSHLLCYQPLFGYQMEKFPLGNLHLGRAVDLTDGIYNFRNPSCYVFPELNKCRPGDNFREGEEKDLAVFLDYGPLRYREPEYMQTARVLSLAVLILALIGALPQVVRHLRNSSSRGNTR